MDTGVTESMNGVALVTVNQPTMPAPLAQGNLEESYFRNEVNTRRPLSA